MIQSYVGLVPFFHLCDEMTAIVITCRGAFLLLLARALHYSLDVIILIPFHPCHRITNVVHCLSLILHLSFIKVFGWPEHIQLLLHFAHWLLQAGQPERKIQQRQKPGLYPSRAARRRWPTTCGPVCGRRTQQRFHLPARYVRNGSHVCL